jgi:hypothetical protein
MEKPKVVIAAIKEAIGATRCGGVRPLGTCRRTKM